MTDESGTFCLPCWNEAREWVDREGGIQVFHYDRLHGHHTPPASTNGALCQHSWTQIDGKGTCRHCGARLEAEQRPIAWQRRGHRATTTAQWMNDRTRAARARRPTRSRAEADDARCEETAMSENAESDAWCLTCGKVIHFRPAEGECQCRVPNLSATPPPPVENGTPVTREEWRIVWPDGLVMDGYDYDVTEDVADNFSVTVEHRTITTTTTPWTRVALPDNMERQLDPSTDVSCCTPDLDAGA